jgi:hypothetical protein
MPPIGVVGKILSPVIDATERIELMVEDAEPLVIRVTATCRNAEDVKVVEQTLQSSIVLLRNIVAAQKAGLAMGAARNAPGAAVDRQAVQQGLAIYDRAAAILNSVEMTSSGPVLTVTARVEDAGTAIADVLAPAILAAREAAGRAVSTNNMQQLALAVHLYADSQGSLPPAVVYGKSVDPALNPTGNEAPPVPRSWRVELLPYLEQRELYKQYRLDQPWDSEANLKVLAQMPDIFRAPEDSPGSTNTSYFAIAGPGTVFAGREGTKFTEITDGTSNTLLFAEAKRPIPWTKPQDIDYDPDQALPPLGGWRENNFIAAMCDGSVHLLTPSTSADFLKRWIEKADGEQTPSPWELQNPDSATPTDVPPAVAP